MPEFVRVTDTVTGHHITISQAAVDAEPSRYRVLQQPAVDANGLPLAPKFRTTVESEVAKKAEKAPAAK